MAELTSMLHSVCRWSDSSALSASAPPEQWDFKFLSCRPHFLSPPAHCRSARSAPPALHCPLQFNRLDFHLIPADKHQLTSLLLTLAAKSILFFKFFKLSISIPSFPFSVLFFWQHKNSPFSSSAVDSCFFFSVLFPPHSSLLIRPVASSPSPPSAT